MTEPTEKQTEVLNKIKELLKDSGLTLTVEHVVKVVPITTDQTK